ncbi:MAG: lysophospholipid acyltransferase family protein [Promethearchaeota archaeon]
METNERSYSETDAGFECGRDGERVPGASKGAEKVLGKILAYNPFDPFNKFVRDVLDKFNLLDKTDKLWYWSMWSPVRQFLRFYWNYRVEGSMFPDFGSGIVVANHQSHLDPFFVGCAAQRRIRWMSKEENFKTPVMTSLFRNFGAFPIKRGSGDAKALKIARRVVKDGEWLGIFPEGTRSLDGQIQPFRSGAIRLAIQLGVPIVPAYVDGSRDVLPKGSLFMKPGFVTVRIGEPIFYDDYYGEEISYQRGKRLAAELREEILKLKELVEYARHDPVESKMSIAGGMGAEARDGSNGGRGKAFDPVRWLKNLPKFTLRYLDDLWYGLLKILEPWNLERHFQDAVHSFSGNAVAAYSRLMNPMKVIGFDENIPRRRGAVVVSNHNSEWDVITLATAIQQSTHRRQLWQMSKQSLFKIPIVNAWVRTHFAFPLRRGEHDRISYLEAKHLLENDELVGIYPEATTNPNPGKGNLLPFHTGAVRLAIEVKKPILPVGITGTERIYPKHAKMLNLGKGCVLKMGKPWLEHKKYWDRPEPPTYGELKDLSEKLRQHVKGLLMYNKPEA